MRILYMGTGDIAVPSLLWAHQQSGHDLVGLVCQPDRPAGRKMTLTPPATKLALADTAVPFFQPEKITTSLDDLAALQPDLIIVMAYGQYLPRRLREMAPLGCINLHASLLPRWRGASPVQAALAAGDAETGVTVMHVAAGMDTGDIILAEKTPITADDTGQSLHDRLAEVASTALQRALPLIVSGQAPRTTQDEALATHCAKLDRTSGVIDWSRPAAEIARQIRAYMPWPGSSGQWHTGPTVKFFPPVTVTDETGPPGHLIRIDKDSLTIATGHQALRITNLQPENKRLMTVRDYLAGHPLNL
jgi:methionyl-tRNA formyltransferase